MARNKKRLVEGKLIELLKAHSELVQTRQNQAQKSNASQILIETFDKETKNLERLIVSTAKECFCIDA